MTLFGSVGTTAAGQASTTGDISKDVALNSPPDDSISDLAFSPVSDHLAVSSWDKKVRIYEINDQGQSEGKALFEHEAPVLNCCWSPVRTPPTFSSFRFLFLSLSVLNLCNVKTIIADLSSTSLANRMERKLSELAQTRLHACLICPPMEPLPCR